MGISCSYLRRLAPEIPASEPQAVHRLCVVKMHFRVNQHNGPHLDDGIRRILSRVDQLELLLGNRDKLRSRSASATKASKKAALLNRIYYSLKTLSAFCFILRFVEFFWKTSEW